MPMRKVVTASDRKTGPDYYTIVAWLDSIIVAATGLRAARGAPTKGATLLSLALLRFFSRRFKDPRDQEAIIQGSAIGWLVTLACSIKEMRAATAGAASWNMVVVSVIFSLLWGRKAIPGR